MPYDPHALTPEGRNLQFVVMWLGLVATIICLVQYVFLPDLHWMAIGYGVIVAGLINAGFSYGSDDYFRSQCHVGMRWSIVLVAIYLSVLFILSVSDLAYVAGYRVSAGGAPDRMPMNAAGYANDATLLAMIVSLAFYAGFASAMLRDRFALGGDRE
ncbi:hypothetical protein [Alteriqipengyuania lutimaris]|uniref:Uncharacterized protein n=1 Tax=Alteriqipengyuania lutimaris TaxID=1538146 RepID=A0A395LM84_9SPHN|nr:hypothetical protein [Alteriqipengyuania lutimaris]MBB3032938.1 hypothetical protein [Alteriqipengyuania lutimaris]RDS77981.1 hypothetical protein DL238_10470 [Alteriqipengyuania lutimaris]